MVDEGDGMALGEAVENKSESKTAHVNRVVVPLELGPEAFRMGGDVPPVGSDGEPTSQCPVRRAGGREGRL